jgi:integrase
VAEEGVMSELRQDLEEYLAVRRAVGFRLVLAGYMLRGFVSELERLGQEKVTTKAAVAWAIKPSHAQPSWWAQRLQMARGFARFLHALDPLHEVPPAGLLVAKPPRVVRHAFSEEDVVRLMESACALEPELRATTYSTLIGLLATTGMRVGEAIGLDHGDVNFDDGTIVIRHAKFDKHRQIPLHQSALGALAAYAERRDALVARTGAPAFFVSRRGARLNYQVVHRTFVGLLPAAGLEGRPRLRPRLHDLRHGFAITTLATWYRQGLDVEQRLPRLATYLGHVDPTNTYWYLRATPELMQLAAGRLEAHLGELP